MARVGQIRILVWFLPLNDAFLTSFPCHVSLRFPIMGSDRAAYRVCPFQLKKFKFTKFTFISVSH